VSTNALVVINEAAALIGDPEFKRVTAEAWRVIENNSCRDLARKLRLVLWTATFDIVANDHEYALPADCLQVKRIQCNETPSDQTTWWEVDEYFEDEFRAVTNGQYSSASRPYRYMAWLDTMDLFPMPDTDITGGGKITYWGLPDDIVTPATQGIPLMDIVRDSLRQRMLVYGFNRLEKYDAAAKAEQEWQATLTVDRDRLEDRSADRRPRIRTRRGNFLGLR
jgi:hypothetical protein